MEQPQLSDQQKLYLEMMKLRETSEKMFNAMIIDDFTTIINTLEKVPIQEIGPWTQVRRIIDYLMIVRDEREKMYLYDNHLVKK
jgi:hypothetical protein